MSISNYLIVGYLNNHALGYLSVYTKNKNIRFICIDEKEPNEYCDFGLEKIKYYHEKITIESMKKIFSENHIDKVINFHELKEPNRTLIEMNRVNYEFVVDLYQLCESYFVRQFVQISSDEVYGRNRYTYSSETHKPSASDHYTASKINADKYLEGKHNVAIVRMCNTFGILYDDNLLNLLIKGLLEDKELVVHEKSDYVRSYLDSKDCAYFLQKILEKYKTGIYNISSEYFLTAKDIIKYFLEVTETTKEITYTNSVYVKFDCIKLDNRKMMSEADYFIEDQTEKLKFYLKQFKGL